MNNIIDIPLNKIMNRTELTRCLGIEPRTFSRRKSEILEYLEGYYMYNSWRDGRELMFIFRECYEPMPPFKHQNDTKNPKIIEDIYHDLVYSEVERNPLFNANSLASSLYETGGNPFNHSLFTMRMYITKELKKDIYSIAARVWVKKVFNTTLMRNEYVELSEEERQEYVELLRKYVYGTTAGIEYEEDYQAGLIDYNKYVSLITKIKKEGYLKVNNEWLETHDYLPRRLNKLEVGKF